MGTIAGGFAIDHDCDVVVERSLIVEDVAAEFWRFEKCGFQSFAQGGTRYLHFWAGNMASEVLGKAETRHVSKGGRWCPISRYLSAAYDEIRGIDTLLYSLRFWLRRVY